MAPRRVTTRTGSPSAKPSEGWTSSQGRGVCWTSPGSRRVWLPDRKWATVRPVVSRSGYASSGGSARGPPLDGDEAGLAVGMIEAAALERPRGARVVQGRAGPEHPAGGLDLVVGD